MIVVAAAVGFGAWQVASRPAADARTTVAEGGVALVGQADRARFDVAVTNLALQQRATGSYAGASMPPGLTLVTADATGFCVQLADGGPVSHLAGPGGGATAGAW